MNSIHHSKDPSGSSDATDRTRVSRALFHAAHLPAVWFSKVPPRAKQKRALLVGICRSDDNISFAELRGPWKDVHDFAQLLQDQYGYSSSDITVMLDAPNHPEHLQPTHENLMRELNTFVKDPMPGDEFVFHYAGHTDQQPNLDGSEEDGQDEVIVTTDGKNILDDELHEMLVKRLIPGCSLVAVLDTCHSQSLLDLPHHRCNRFSKHRRMWRKANELLTAPPTPADLQESQSHCDTPVARSGTRGNLSRRNTVTSIKRGVNTFCRGTCHRIANRNQPYVLCVSACKDMQEAFDDVSMTSALIQVLQENRRPTLKELMREVSSKLAHQTRKVDEGKARKYIAQYRKWIATQKFRQRLLLRMKPVPQSIRRKLPDPQLSSLSPLFLKDHLSL